MGGCGQAAKPPDTQVVRKNGKIWANFGQNRALDGKNGNLEG